MTEPWVVSPSQLAEWRLCPRKLLWRIVVGIKPPETKGTLLGGQVHNELERWLNNQPPEDYDALSILTPAIEYFPKPGECETEQKLKFKWGDHWYGGRFDARDTTRIYDLKTTKDKKWAKTQTELICDPQPIIYFKASADSVASCRWVYTLTGKTRKAWAVDFTPIQSGPVVEAIHGDAEQITRAVLDKRLPLAYPPPRDLGCCSAYGGCPYRSQCTDISPLATLMSNKGIYPQMSLNDILNRMKQSVGTSEDVPTVEPAAINPPEQSLAGPPPLPETVKPKRGRPKVATKTEQLPEPPTPPAPVETKSEGNVAATPPLSIAMLFIDCLPMGELGAQVQDVAVYVARAHQDIREQLKINDFTFQEFTGAGLLNAAVQASLAESDASKDASLMLFIDSSTRESRIIMSDLVAKASLVIRRC